MKILSLLLSVFTLLSPDGAIEINVNADRHADLSYTVKLDGNTIISPSAIGQTLEGGIKNGGFVNPVKVIRRSIDETSPAIVYKKSEVRNNCNEMQLVFKTYKLVVRAYNDGVAYRFVQTDGKPVTILEERAEFNFPSDYDAIQAYVRGDQTSIESQFTNSFENIYTPSKVSEWDRQRIAFLPTAFVSENARICISEADLLHYPGMFLYNPDGRNGVKAVFAGYPEKTMQGGYNSIQDTVLCRYPYIAKLEKGQKMPWRVIGIGREDKDLLNSDLVYNLSTPAADTDWSWVKPGLVAWDWWNNWSLRGVPFLAGINNKTYEYYIDFAAAYGVPYVILDDGWSKTDLCNLMNVIPEIDLPHLIQYGREKGVGLILWAGYLPFNRDMENVCRHYSEMGIKGFKVDFMDRDDQPIVEFYERAASTAAKYHLILDFHGAFKPAGLQRTYPNVLNFEGVFGMEQMKWDAERLNQPDYDATLPFVRLFAGPMDYTPGAMRNASQWTFHPDYSEPMSQGTRCHQMAEYIVFEQPLGMLSDSPSNYYANPECTKFIAGVPTVWDETVSLAGKIGKYAVLARRSGDTWYVGGISGWEDSAPEISLDFLGEGDYTMQLFYDGPNARKVASDWAYEEKNVNANSCETVSMCAGGGWAAKIVKK